jgi:hypothetical protein
MDDSLPQFEVPTTEADFLYLAALEFNKKIETSPTADICLCPWTDLGNGRKVRGNVHPMCPHSPEGKLYAFVQHLKGNGWKVRFNPPTPAADGTTLEVQSTAQGSSTYVRHAAQKDKIKLPGMHPMDLIDLVEPEKLTPDQWLFHDDYADITIHDADGWKSKNAPAWETPITRTEFDSRLSQCTIGRKPKSTLPYGYRIRGAQDGPQV